MPKKDKARKKRTGNESRDLVYKEEDQEYAVAGKMLGDGKFKAMCQDGKERLCVIRGALRNRVWVSEGDTVLVGIRSFEPDKADVILRYSPDETRQLKKAGELTIQTVVADEAEKKAEEEENGFDFESI